MPTQAGGGAGGVSNSVIAGATIAGGIVVIVMVVVLVVLQRRATGDAVLPEANAADGGMPGNAAPMLGVVIQDQQPAKQLSVDTAGQPLLQDVALFQNMLHAIVAGDDVGLQSYMAQAAAGPSRDAAAPSPEDIASPAAALVPGSPQFEESVSAVGSPAAVSMSHLKLRPVFREADGTGHTLLTWAVRLNNARAANMLLLAGADVSPTPTHHLATPAVQLITGSVGFTIDARRCCFPRRLLNQPVFLTLQVHVSNRNGQQALHFACMTNPDLGMVEALLQMGADPNARDSEGTTPFLFACRCGSVPLCEMLLSSGAEVGDKAASAALPKASRPDHLLRPRANLRPC